MLSLTVNGKTIKVDIAPDTPILWVLRDALGMTGTKFGCGIALCGACTVHLDGAAIRSCVTPVSAAAGKKITTIEAMSAGKVGKAVQAAWIKHDVPQCGYCQSGQIMSAGAARRQRQAERCRHRRRDERQPLPLRHLQPDPRRHPRCGRASQSLRRRP